MRSFLVFKVKFRDSLRRFSARVLEDGQLELNMEALRIKLLKLYSLAPDTDLKLTYIDQDGDEVTMVDDNDLNDVMMQKLNPVRVGVILNETRCSGSSRPVTSPNFQNQLPVPSIDIVKTLKPILDMLNEQLSAPLSDVLDDCFARITQSVNSQASQPEDETSDFAETLKSKLDSLKEQLLKVPSDSEVKAMPSAPVSEVLADQFSKFMQSISGEAYQPEDKHDPHTSQQLPNTNRAVAEIFVLLMEPVNKKFLKTLDQEIKMLDALLVTFLKVGKSSNSGVAKSQVVSNKQNVGSESTTTVSNTVDSVTEAVDLAMKDSTRSSQNITQTASSCGSFEEHVCPVTASEDLNTLPPDFPHPLPPLPGLEGAHDFSIESIAPSSNDEKAMKAGDTQSCGMPLLTGSYAKPNSAIPSTEGFVTSSEGISPVHVNYQCDGCDSYPITGPRFRSKVKQNYDLCSICLSKMGKEDDFNRIDHPVHNPSVSQHQLSEPVKPAPQCSKSSHFKFVSKPLLPLRIFSAELDSRFVLDVNFKDGTLVAPSSPFTKIWRMRNNGKLTWPRGTQLVWTGGDRFSSAVSTEIKVPEEGLPSGKEIDIAISFIAPKNAGCYISYWRMASPTGERFGQQVWAKIQVLSVVPKDSLDNQNSDKKMSVLDFNVCAVEEDSIGKMSSDETRRKERGKSIAVEQDSGPNPRNSRRSSGILSGSRRGTAPFLNSSKLADFRRSSSSSINEDRSDSFFNKSDSEVEEILLKDLETCGFKYVELNRMVLKKNDYNLYDALDELCRKHTTDEWSAALEKLKAMGFGNRKLNKELLIKYNGDVLAVIMEQTGIW